MTKDHHSDPAQVAERYVIEELLGRGGMASVYRAFDPVEGRHVALKVMAPDQDDARSRRNVELFEREFHTLAHFAHPRVVAAYDYGIDGDTPYYTMELLDGGDLQELAPMPWGDVCVAAYELCSALALVHSRGLVHRDLTPRNVRRTADGKAKLIDFGLLSPMGPTTLLAGTPPFVAPELVGTLSLDGRSDLFSLGATLYFALTGTLAYPARHFDQLRDVWRSSPVAPSLLIPGELCPPRFASIAPQVGELLDELILGLLRIDAASRPKTAAEVMDRLLPLLPREPEEELRVASAYLTTPQLVGRDALVDRMRKHVIQAVRRQGSGLAIVGDSGTGRSRMLDAFVLEAKLTGATVVRASAGGAVAFGVAASLAKQLFTASPKHALAAAQRSPLASALFVPAHDVERSLVDGEPPAWKLVPVAALDRRAAHAALRSWFLAYADERPLAIAVDDIDHVDEPSAALLASLAWEAPRRKLVYAVTREPKTKAPPAAALSILDQHATRLELRPLDAAEVRSLLVSVFGDVPHVGILASKLHALCDGRPRECMTLARFLVDQGAVSYASGAWILPSEISDGFLPASLEDAFRRQIAGLSPLARRVAALLSIDLVGHLDRSALLQLNDADAGAIDAALDELTVLHLIGGEPSGYAPRHGSLARMLSANLEPSEVLTLHARLARFYESAAAHLFVIAYHQLQGPEPETGVDTMVQSCADSVARVALIARAFAELGSDRTARTLRRGLDVAERAGRRTRDLQIFWVLLAGTSAQGESAEDLYRVRAPWLEQLKRDSGWDVWQTLEASGDPSARALTAVAAAVQRFDETPENERVLAPSDAIRQLVSYVVFSVGVSARALDLETMATLPSLLEPFAPLNPMVRAMLDNAHGTLLHGLGKREAARETFREVLLQLGEISGAELGYVEKVRASLFQTLGEIDASLGVPSPWVERLGDAYQDSNQIVGAQYLRKVTALQHGDWELAEEYRQQGELHALQSNVTPMFSTLARELEAHAMARDLTGLRQVRANLQRMASEHPGWEPVLHVADAHYRRLCGDLEGALSSAATVVKRGECGALRSPWAAVARTLEAEILAELGRAEEGLVVAARELEACETDGMRYLARGAALAVAACEAGLGRFEDALARVERVIAEQQALGVTGLQLGRSYEIGARIALTSRDGPRFAAHADLAREQYRPGKSSVLGALYERLMEDARRAGLRARTDAPLESGEYLTAESRERVTTALAGCTNASERAERALALLCDGDPPVRGHLFLLAESGLTLVATNSASPVTKELTAFAETFLRSDVDVDAESVDTAAVTEARNAPTDGADAVPTDVAGTLSRTGDFYAPDGTSYGALLLACVTDEKYRIAGMVLLTGANTRFGELAQLAEAIARALIDAGDVSATRAA